MLSHSGRCVLLKASIFVRMEKRRKKLRMEKREKNFIFIFIVSQQVECMCERNKAFICESGDFIFSAWDDETRLDGGWRWMVWGDGSIKIKWESLWKIFIPSSIRHHLVAPKKKRKQICKCPSSVNFHLNKCVRLSCSSSLCVSLVMCKIADE